MEAYSLDVCLWSDIFYFCPFPDKIFWGEKMKKIVTITGHKNSGKVNVASKLCENSEVYFIKPYTDSEIVTGDFHFVSKNELDQKIKDDELLSCTTINGHRYCFFKSQLQVGFNVMIVDDYALVDVQNRWGGEIYSIKVWNDNQEDSDRVGVYLYNHEFDEVFHYGVDDIEDLEWRIGYDFD